MASLNGPQTYNDQRLDDMSRALFALCVQKMQTIIEDESKPFPPERLQALAACADAAYAGVVPEKDSEYD